MVRRKAGTNEAVSDKLGKEENISIGEIGDKGGVEQAAEHDVKMAGFMNDLVTVLVHADGAEGALDVVTPMVNGVNQPIVRGQEQKIKRKYVEALARSRLTVYDQLVQNPSKPENIQMVPRTVLTYPFAVVNDPHPNGKPWLDQILAQP
jgi:hypothetical protein